MGTVSKQALLDFRIPIRELAPDGSAEDRELRKVASGDQTVSLSDLDAYIRTGTSFAGSAVVRALRPRIEAHARSADIVRTQMMIQARAGNDTLLALSESATSAPLLPEIHVLVEAQRQVMASLERLGMAPHALRELEQLRSDFKRACAVFAGQGRAPELTAQQRYEAMPEEKRRRYVTILVDAAKAGARFVSKSGAAMVDPQDVLIALMNRDTVVVGSERLTSLEALEVWHEVAFVAEQARKCAVTPERRANLLRILGAAGAPNSRSNAKEEWRFFTRGTTARLAYQDVIDRLGRGEQVTATTNTYGAKHRDLSSIEELEIWAEETRNPYTIQVRLLEALGEPRYRALLAKVDACVSAGWTLQPASPADFVRALFSREEVILLGQHVEKTFTPAHYVKEGLDSYWANAGWDEEIVTDDTVRLTSIEALEALAVVPPRRP